jgi:beta-glucanase (GH16 family)
MKKNSYLILLSFIISTGLFAQTSLSDDFESPSTDLPWFADDCFMDTHFVNPFPNADNSSNRVMRYEDIGGTFANVGFNYPQNFNLSGNHEFSLWIYIDSSSLTGNAPNQISLKLQNGNLAAPWSTQTEIVKSLNVDQWEYVTFDFNSDNYTNLDPNSPPPSQRDDLNRMLLQVNGENNNANVIAYIDSFLFTSDNDNSTPGHNFTELVWQDEFNYSGPVDDTKWFHQTQLPQGNSWYNGEIQHYTDRIENAEVSNGTLKIRARAEVYFDQGVTKNYTSARLNSKYAFTYGKVDIRAKLPTGVGTWPALWTLGQNIDENGGYWDNQGFDTTPWPACGELDIMEHWGDNQNYVSSAIHTPSSFGATVNHGGQTIPTVSTDFHVYTMIWTEDFVEFQVDGVTHYVYDPPVKDPNTWPFDAPQYFLFNVAILPIINGTGFTQSALEVDYIRVYQEENLGVNDNDLSTIKVYPNPVRDILYIQNENVQEYQLFNKLGILVKQGEVVADQINFNDLSTGVYILKLKNSSQNVFTKKLIKL